MIRIPLLINSLRLSVVVVHQLACALRNVTSTAGKHVFVTPPTRERAVANWCLENVSPFVESGRHQFKFT